MGPRQLETYTHGSPVPPGSELMSDLHPRFGMSSEPGQKSPMYRKLCNSGTENGCIPLGSKLKQKYTKYYSRKKIGMKDRNEV